MSNRGNLLKFQVQQDIYDAKSMLDENNWYHSRQGKPDELSSKLTYLLGDNLKNFPISMMTHGNIIGEGKFKKASASSRELQDIQYTYPVMGRTNKASVVADSLYSAGEKPGIGNSTFEIPFTDNWIKRHYIIESESRVQAYVTKDLEQRGEYWIATCVLNPALPSDFCDISQLTAGARWIDLNTANPESESRGTEFKRAYPGKVKNQMSVVRLSHSWAGSSADKVMSITVDAGENKQTKLWMDLEVWEFEKDG